MSGINKTKFKKLIADELSVIKGSCALLLSGGVDSLTCAFALMELGIDFKCYTFYIDSTPSEDTKHARIACKLFGWELVEIDIPTKYLEEDFKELSSEWRCAKKTQFECMYAFIYLIDEIEEDYIVSGICADTLYGTSKKANIHFKNDKPSFDEYRIKAFSGNPEGVLNLLYLCDAYGKYLVTPFFTDNMLSFMLTLSHADLNKPKQKHLPVSSYKNFQKVKHRRNQNLQLCSGISIAFESLLTSDINKNNRSRVMDICRDYASSEPITNKKEIHHG